jgi:hypothetical protein
MSPCVCGTYINLKGQTFEKDDDGRPSTNQIDKILCQIPIKIPITNFLILRDMKYLMSWMGKWEIRLFFSPQNLVILPIHPQKVSEWWNSYVNDPETVNMKYLDYWSPTALSDDDRATYKVDKESCLGNTIGEDIDSSLISHYESYPEVEGWLKDIIQMNKKLRFRGHNRFVQFGDPIPCCVEICNGKGHGDDKGHRLSVNNCRDTKDTSRDYSPWREVELSLIKMEMYDVEFIGAQFQIRMDVMEMIKSKYLSEKPLTFPVSTVQVSRFTGLPTMGELVGKNEQKSFTMVLCQAINNVDTIYILPYMSHFQHTVCYQPWLESFQLHAGEYGAYPVQPMPTYQTYDNRLKHMKYNNYISDALNVAHSKIVGYNRDLCYEFCPKTFLTSSQRIQSLNDFEKEGVETYENQYKNHDDSNFFIALPFSTEGDFQGGLSSPVSNINFKVEGTFKPPIKMKFSTPWVCLFLVDGVLMIRPDPMSDAAKVIWSDRTVI